MQKPTQTQLDAVLPQTQCGDCTYTGCKPYAQAIAEKGERIDLCLPGGVEVLKQLAGLTGQSAEPLIPGMEERAKPAQIAVIQENICIGCTKCIKACPVDAIIGASKKMHAIITDECSGCELCIPPCPMNCIDLLPLPEPSATEKNQRAQQYKQRFEARNQRLERQAEQKQQRQAQQFAKTTTDRQALIAAAVARAQQKKQESS